MDAQIEQAEKDLKGVLQSDRLAKLAKLQSLAIPTFEKDIGDALERTIMQIEVTARERLAAHFRRFELGKQGEAWISYGLEHIQEDSCPFCGKGDVGGTGLVTVYSQIFGEAYKAHFNGIRETADRIDKSLGPDAQAALSALAAKNAETVVSWTEFYALGSEQLPSLHETLNDIATAHRALKSLFDIKRLSPLTPIQDTEALKFAADKIERAARTLTIYNSALINLAEIVEIKKSGIRLTESHARNYLSNLIKRKRRNDPGVQTRIAVALSAKRRDNNAKRIRSIVQERLKEKNEENAAHYHERVNHYLTQFGVKFRISPIRNAMTGNIGSVDYGLIVRGQKVARGRGRGKRDEPTFMNTLSTGDKTTLAFAFFLANIDQQPVEEVKEQIVVFDDPLSSHDTHRRAKTVDLIFDLYKRCSQVIVLSHDAYFLRLVHRRCNQSPRVVYEIAFDGAEDWSIAKETDLTVLCEREHTKRLNKLHIYYEFRQGKPSDVAPAIRTVLETHFRSAFSAYFGGTTNLGEIVQRIKDHGPSHPCWKNHSDLDSCNVNTLSEHHGDDPNVRANEPIDPDELRGLVKTCLLLVHAIQPEQS